MKTVNDWDRAVWHIRIQDWGTRLATFCMWSAIALAVLCAMDLNWFALFFVAVAVAMYFLRRWDPPWLDIEIRDPEDDEP